LIDGFFWLFERGDDRNFYSFDNLLKMTTTLITIPTDKVTIRPPLLKTAIVFSGKTLLFNLIVDVVNYHMKRS
jgi:hypothetical protein